MKVILIVAVIVLTWSTEVAGSEARDKLVDRAQELIEKFATSRPSRLNGLLSRLRLVCGLESLRKQAEDILTDIDEAIRDGLKKLGDGQLDLICKLPAAETICKLVT